jgi:dihydrofolate reductase
MHGERAAPKDNGMRQLTSIVAVNWEGVIGAGNALPWRVRSDMLFFKQQTLNNVVVMGRNTYDSLGKCLPERYNIIVTHRLSLFHKEYGCAPVCGIEEALYRAEATPKRYKELFVIGGESMYRQFAGYVDRYLITIIDKRVDGDTFLDPYIFGELADWNIRLLEEGPARPPQDEARFEILELTPKDGDARRAKRARVIEAYGQRLARKQTSRSNPPEDDGETLQLSIA